eukprot:8932414-Heterocapsa_arctica.AAC.1
MEELRSPLLSEHQKFGATVPPARVKGSDGSGLMAKDGTQAFRRLEQPLTIVINLVVAGSDICRHLAD